jgi:hypothetical protein
LYDTQAADKALQQDNSSLYDTQAADKALQREVRALLEKVLRDGGVAAVASTYVCIVSNDTGMGPLIKEVHTLGAKPLVISNNKTLRPLAIASSSWRDLGTWIYHSDI